MLTSTIIETVIDEIATENRIHYIYEGIQWHVPSAPVPAFRFLLRLYVKSKWRFFKENDILSDDNVCLLPVVGKVTVIKLLRYVTSYFFKKLVTVSLLSK